MLPMARIRKCWGKARVKYTCVVDTVGDTVTEKHGEGRDLLGTIRHQLLLLGAGY